MNWIDYLFCHCWMTGWQSIGRSFRIWSDFMRGNYKDYALMPDDDPYTECYSWFWDTLGEDETLPKAFLEHLQQMVEDIHSGKVKTYPLEDVMKELDELLKEQDETEV